MTTSFEKRNTYWEDFTGSGGGMAAFTTNLGISDKYVANEEFHRQMFNAFDKNSNGNIEQGEVGVLLTSLGHTASEARLNDMIRELDQDQNGVLNYSEFLVILNRVKGGEMTYQPVQYVTQTAAVVVEAGPGRSSPPSYNLQDLSVRGAYQRSNIDTEGFGGAIQQLKTIEEGHHSKTGNLLVDLRNKISGCGGSIDVSGHLGPLGNQFNILRAEHNQLLQENARLASQNSQLIGYVGEFESRQASWEQRNFKLTEDNRAAMTYIAQINKQKKVWEMTMREKDVEIQRLMGLLVQIEEWKQKWSVSQNEVQRLTSLLPQIEEWKQKWSVSQNEVQRLSAFLVQIEEWKQKWSVSQNEVQRLSFSVKDLEQQLALQRQNYEVRIKDYRGEIAFFVNKSSEFEILLESMRGEHSMLSSKHESLRLGTENMRNMLLGEHEQMKAKINNSLSGAIREKFSSMASREISNDALIQKVTNNTVQYFTQLGGSNSLSREDARQCLSQILTNAHGIPYAEVEARLNAGFDSHWSGQSKAADGTLHGEHYQGFFQSAFAKFVKA